MSYSDIIIATQFAPIDALDIVQRWIDALDSEAYSVRPLPYRVAPC